MKARCIPWLLASLLAALPAQGQDAKPTPGPPHVALTYPFTTGTAGFSIPGNVGFVTTPFHAYGGEPLTLLLTAQAPLGTHLRIYADVSQQAAGIAAPWQRHTPISEEIIFADRTSMAVACTFPALRAVQRKTRLSVTLHTETKPPVDFGGLAIPGFVYPREEPGAWKKQFAALLARSGVRRVAVFGGSKNTAGFLRGQKVAFDDLGGDWPAEPDAHTLYLGSVFPKPGESGPPSLPRAFGETPGVRLVLFEPWDTEVLPPGVYQSANAAGGGVWKVTLPDLFAGIGQDDPHALETLTTLFEQVLTPNRNATGNNPEPTPTP